MKSFKEIENKYSKVLDEVETAVRKLLDTIDIQEIAKYNVGLSIYGQFRYEYFIQREKRRFLLTLDEVNQSKMAASVCDLGCFIPYLPIALSLTGHKVKIVDKYSMYSQSFKDNIRRISDDYDIEVHDLDILYDDIGQLESVDVVLLMAVLEHLNGSPKRLMESIRSIMRPDALLFSEIPNIAEFSKRIRMLFGHSPLPKYKDYFYSKYPYAGHNREMTVEEVRFLFETCGFHIMSLLCYDYSEHRTGTLASSLVRLLKRVAPLRHKGEVIWVKCRFDLSYRFEG